MFIVEQAHIEESKSSVNQVNYCRLILKFSTEEEVNKIIDLLVGDQFESEDVWQTVTGDHYANTSARPRDINIQTKLGLTYTVNISKYKSGSDKHIKIVFPANSTIIVLPEIFNILEMEEVYLKPDEICNIREKLGLLTTEMILNEVVILLLDMQDDDLFCEQFTRINAPYLQTIKSPDIKFDVIIAIAKLLAKHDFINCATLMLQPIRHYTKVKELIETFNHARASAFLCNGIDKSENEGQRLARVENKLPDLLCKYGGFGRSLAKKLLPEVAGCGCDFLSDDKGQINLEEYASDPTVIIRVLSLLRTSKQAVSTPAPRMLTAFSSKVANDNLSNQIDEQQELMSDSLNAPSNSLS